MTATTVRGLAAALNGSGRYKYKPPEMAVDHLVIGGGVVGLAIAQRLAERYPRKSTYLVERHTRAGEETSSRNSEVIHAGLYYAPDSFKTKLCIRGRDLLYRRCATRSIPHKTIGKLVVGLAHQKDYLTNLHHHAQNLPSSYSPKYRKEGKPPIPSRLLTGDEAREMEPDLSADIAHALWSPETGIISSHGLMESLEKDIQDSEAAELVYSTRVVRVDPLVRPPPMGNGDKKRGGDGSLRGWVVQTVTESPDGGNTDGDALLARVVINASGLSAHLLLNSLQPSSPSVFPSAASPMPLFYSRGSYASYRGPGVSNVSHLIYPVPDSGGNKKHAHQSLGTHLTLDMEGNVRFGPDVEWISPPSSSATTADGHSTDLSDIDFWSRHLVATEERLQSMHRAVTSYLSGITLEGLAPDYVGIRPKLSPPGSAFDDFRFFTHDVDDFVAPTPADVVGVEVDTDSLMGLSADDGSGKPSGAGKMFTLLGIESPGLTSSLAIAEVVERMVTERVWGGGGKGKKALVDEVGPIDEKGLDGWA